MRTDKRLKEVNKEKNVDRRIQKTKTSWTLSAYLKLNGINCK